jgi:hypothetical protein
MLALLGAHPFLHVSRIRVKEFGFAIENTSSKCRVSDKRCCDKTGAS